MKYVIQLIPLHIVLCCMLGVMVLVHVSRNWLLLTAFKTGTMEQYCGVAFH